MSEKEIDRGDPIGRALLHSLTTTKKDDWKTGSKKMHERIPYALILKPNWLAKWGTEDPGKVHE